MIPEPFTATAASLGLLSTLFGLLITSVKTNANIVADWKAFETTLESYRNRIDNCMSRLERISCQWQLRGSDVDADYRYLLGEKGLDGMRRRLQSISENYNAVLSLFGKGYDVDEPARPSWRDRIKRQGVSTAQLPMNDDKPVPSVAVWQLWASRHISSLQESGGMVVDQTSFDASAVTKVAFVLIRSDDLNKKVEALETAVSTLKGFLDDRYEQLPSVIRVKPKEVSLGYLNELLEFHKLTTSFSSAFSRLVWAADQQHQTCGFQTKEFDHPETLIRMMEEIPQRFDLFLRDETQGTNATYTPASVVWPFSTTSPTGVYAQVSREPLYSWSADRVWPMRLLFENLTSRDQVSRRSYHSYSSCERLGNVLALLSSARLSWDTPWAADFCCCHMERHVVSDDNAVFCMLPWTSTEATPCLACSSLSEIRDEEKRYFHVGRDKHSTLGLYPREENDAGLANRAKLFALGRTLSEVALLTDVEMVRNRLKPSELTFLYQGRQRSFIEMLDDVRAEFPGRAYRALVASCLGALSNHAIRTAPFDELCETLEKLSQPLRKWYNEVALPHFRVQSSRRWSQARKSVHDGFLRDARQPPKTHTQEDHAAEPAGTGQPPPDVLIDLDARRKAMAARTARKSAAASNIEADAPLSPETDTVFVGTQNLKPRKRLPRPKSELLPLKRAMYGVTGSSEMEDIEMADAVEGGSDARRTRPLPYKSCEVALNTSSPKGTQRAT